uniref:Origin recognition complex subunit 4 n=1 Tax=Ditylenchus dipsaci TaxID=166011 RepID=A0A915EGC2_9BILA
MFTNISFQCHLNESKLLSQIPQPRGQWTQLTSISVSSISTNQPASESQRAEKRVQFLLQVLRYLIRINSMMIVVHGRSGCGKTRFIYDLAASLSPDRWSVHLLKLSAETSAQDMLNSILGCNLVRVNTHLYASANQKCVLIILEGLSRLPYTSANCAYEMLRTLFDTGQILNANGDFIKFSDVYFLAEFTTDLVDPEKLDIPVRLRRFVFPFLCEITDFQNPKNICTSFAQMFGDFKGKEGKLNDANEVELIIKQEMKRNFGKIEHEDIMALCHKYTNIVRPFKEAGELEEKKLVCNFKKANQPEIMNIQSAQEELHKVLLTKKLEPSQKHFLQLHEHLTTHVTFMHKILNLPKDGHCILIGS